jgi:hypothetical protein
MRAIRSEWLERESLGLGVGFLRFSPSPPGPLSPKRGEGEDGFLSGVGELRWSMVLRFGFASWEVLFGSVVARYVFWL